MSELKDLHTKIFTLHTGTRPKAKDVMKAVDRFVEKACEEQRNLCQKLHDEGNPKVRNAKTPEYK